MCKVSDFEGKTNQDWLVVEPTQVEKYDSQIGESSPSSKGWT